ncbi:hypothetical protein CNMCM5793_006697 [Aspergillus hiratsukae]|uniref:Zn(2)-C6 fungal-type domain-containing protein n=1 Tax=Aspergillus hiratsukae TaxID=1194566 RepID=A0A8H6P628_9EURO|nr:hypothetical protein CNMCM5793_006697 [Aspergillus hiratsukae]
MDLVFNLTIHQQNSGIPNKVGIHRANRKRSNVNRLRILRMFPVQGNLIHHKRTAGADLDIGLRAAQGCSHPKYGELHTMVGVPRSNGCRTCLQRRVKCDLTEPQCQRCQKRGQDCPGYEKRWKFCDETGPKARKIQRRSQAPQGQTQTQTAVHQADPPHLGTGTDPIMTVVARKASIDERVQPSLAGLALDVQQREIFCRFLLTNFPAQFASCGARVEVNWIDYARDRPSTSATVSQALLWAFRTIATLFMGKANKDRDKITCSRHMYSRALGYLSGLIGHPKFSKDDETLAAAILLAIYEMADGTGWASWLSHTRGVATLIRLRGPEAHRRGFGVTLLKSCRSFLVADAFVRGETCFLGDPEWRALMTELADSESQASTKSELGLIVDRAFIEVASCPARLIQTKTLLADRSDVAPTRETLVKDITNSRNVLTDLRSKLEIGVVTRKEETSFTGPIPWNFVDSFAQSSLHGMRSGIALLDQLLTLINADSRRRQFRGHILQLDYPAACASNPWAAMERESASWQVQFDPKFLQSTFNISPDTNDDYMDRIAMSMGMLGLRL